ncbi:MAG: N-acetylmuramoyl-L-alanine amidase [Gammaproteobacteria bacterium]
MRKRLWLVYHTASFAPLVNDVPEPRDCSAEDINAWHKANKWGSRKFMRPPIGYNYVIRWNGLIEPGRMLAEPGAHLRGLNSIAFSICFSGHGDYMPLTAEQVNSGVMLGKRLGDEYHIPVVRMIGHRESHKAGIPNRLNKSCPGKLVDMDRLRNLIRNGSGRL